MPWGVAAAAVAAYGSYAASENAKKGQQGAANKAMAATQQNYDRTATNLNPYITAGGNALGTMQALNNGDFSAFKVSPDYQFALTQGLQGLDRSAAARGSLYSGGHSADVLGYASGLASQNYNNFYNRLAGLAQTGQSAASNLGSVGTGNAATIGSASMYAANANANAAYNNANTLGNFAGQAANAFGNWYGNQGSPTSSSYNLGGNGAQSYQVNDGSYQNNGTFNFATAGTGTGGSYY